MLCLVDDAHWLDAGSSDALQFVARRLDAEGVVLLFSAREGDVRVFEAPDVPSHTVDGLDDAAAAELLAHAAASAAPQVRERLLEQTHGNALALVELPTALSAAQLAGDEPLPEALPMTRRLERVFHERVARLPAPTRLALLAAAADDSESAAVVERAVATLSSGALRARRGRAGRAAHDRRRAARVPPPAGALRGLRLRHLERAARGPLGARGRARGRRRAGRSPRLAPGGVGAGARRGHRAGARRGGRARRRARRPRGGGEGARARGDADNRPRGARSPARARGGAVDADRARRRGARAGGARGSAHRRPGPAGGVRVRARRRDAAPRPARATRSPRWSRRRPPWPRTTPAARRSC